MKPLFRSAAPFGIFLLVYGAYVVLTYKDYSITFDEAFAMEGGQRIFEYHFKGDRQGAAVSDPAYLDHNYSYAALLIALTGGKPVPQEIYHLLSMLFALLMYGGAYALFLSETDHPYWALAGPFSLFLSPVLMGHMPANFMDGPNAVVFFLGVLAIHFTRDLPRSSLVRTFILGVAFGLAAGLRLSGLVLFPALLSFDLLKGSRGTGEGWGRWLLREGLSLTAILIVSQVAMALTWPYLGHDYFGRIRQVFQAASHLPWTNGTVYFGKLIPNVHLPWHYLPVWVVLTTPWTLVVFSVLGLHPYFRRRKDPWALTVLVSLGAIFLAWLLVRPIVHSGIRHFLFILPILSLWGARVLVDFLRNIAFGPRSFPSAKALAFLSVLCLGATVTTAVRIHPFQYIYYSEIIGGFPGGMGLFEQDYWFNSNKEAIAWIKERVAEGPSGGPCRVNAPGQDFQVQYYTRPELRFMGGAPGDYYIRSAKDGPYPPDLAPKLVHTVSRMGVPLCWVFQRDPNGTGQETTPFP